MSAMREKIEEVTIANGASLSGIVTAGRWVLVGVQMPTAWTAAGMTFANGVDGTNFFKYENPGGTELALTVAASDYVYLDPHVTAGLRNFKVVSGTFGTQVNQGADRTIKLFFRNWR